MDLVSIIIPAYNCQGYIQPCLESILKQTYQCLEVIIVNDGSTDDTLTVLNEYGQKYSSLIKIYTTENRGQGHARNYAVRQASGRYLLFVDSDDHLEENMVEVLVNSASQNESTLVICAYSRVSVDGELLYHEMTHPNPEVINMNTSPWNKLFERKIWVDNNVCFSE